MHHVRQFECKVILDSKLDSKFNFGIPNWFGSPPCFARFLDSPSCPRSLARPPHHLHDS
jgi:hypothetical protein